MNPRMRVALFRGAGAVLEALPESTDRFLARVGGRIFYRVSAEKRRVVAENLKAILGAEADRARLERLVAASFDSYAQYWAESAKLPALSPATISSRFVISEGQEHLVAAAGAGKGVIVALPHLGSWEWGGAFLARLGMPMLAVAEVLDPPELFEWFAQKRREIGIEIAPLDERAGGVLLARLRAGGIVGLLCDRDIQGNGVEVEFFGHRVTLPAGPATLALRTGAAIVVAACYSGPGRDHHAIVRPALVVERQGRLGADVVRVTQMIATELEGLIRRAPEQWHVLEERFA
jgi:phosphatidylinositol dimannoside acyltransferase